MYYYPQNAGTGYVPYQNQFQSQQNQPFLKGRPVSSIEEVRAAQIDFDGSLFVFPDVANKRIYTKQINLDGTASLNMYELVPTPQTTNVNYVTKDEFQQALSQLRNDLVIAPTTTDEELKPAFKF